jgi:hypothetical protein
VAGIQVPWKYVVCREHIIGIASDTAAVNTWAASMLCGTPAPRLKGGSVLCDSCAQRFYNSTAHANSKRILQRFCACADEMLYTWSSGSQLGSRAHLQLLFQRNVAMELHAGCILAPSGVSRLLRDSVAQCEDTDWAPSVSTERRWLSGLDESLEGTPVSSFKCFK